MTHENELTTEVDLCTPDGDRLNRAALGWSRRPLHRANLEGHYGINKRWDYWAVLAGDLVVSSVYADIDHFGLADVWWADLADGTTISWDCKTGAASVLAAGPLLGTSNSPTGRAPGSQAPPVTLASTFVTY